MRGPHELLVEQTKQTVQSEVDLLEQAKKHKAKPSRSLKVSTLIGKQSKAKQLKSESRANHEIQERVD